MDNKILIEKELAKLARRKNPNGRRARVNRRTLEKLGWTEEPTPVVEAPKPKAKPKAKKKATKK
tara:strand:+ start:232 stop:423 length:192 start_codon:yes stop_codon:yes gene_type:complete